LVSVVPINLSLIHLAIINAGTLIVCMLMMFLPSFVISRISPIKAIRFD
jgi:lipoprotein-releasing system permease protein